VPHSSGLKGCAAAGLGANGHSAAVFECIDNRYIQSHQRQLNFKILNCHSPVCFCLTSTGTGPLPGLQASSHLAVQVTSGTSTETASSTSTSTILQLPVLVLQASTSTSQY
jgi:hypothetical protein